MSRLAEQLANAEAEVAALKAKIGAAECDEIGEHKWKIMGGANAGCGPDCMCSVTVHKCVRCGEWDYGKNPEAATIRANCPRKEEPTP